MLIDIAAEAFASLTQRPLRTLLTMLGTTLGIAAFVATTGITSTASAQIGRQFDRLKATQVLLQASTSGQDPFPIDTDARLANLHGVRAGGVYTALDRVGLSPRAFIAVSSGTASGGSVLAATPGAVAASLPRLAEGRAYDEGAQQRGDRVALLGRVVAKQLGINQVDNFPAVLIGDRLYLVIGIIDADARLPDILTSAVIPVSSAIRDFGTTPDQQFQGLVDVRPGSAAQVARESVFALRPDMPDSLQALAPPDPSTFRNVVESDVASLVFASSVVVLLIGAFVIANSGLIAVIERRHEIAVRRALGAKRSQVAGQFLFEAGLTGLLGGMLGLGGALLLVVAVSVAREWTATISSWVIWAAPLVGVTLGVLAGVPAAFRSARGDISTNLRG